VFAHTPLLRFSGLRISLFAFLMLLSMTMFGQNYGNFQANQIPSFPGSLSVSLGNGTIIYYIIFVTDNGRIVRKAMKI
jgi:hypothetical protein